MDLPRLALLTDDRTVALLATRALADDFDVRAFFSDASGVVDDIAAFHPSVVVLRGVLAGGGALDVMRALRGDERVARVPVVVLSNDSSAGAACIAEGAAAFVAVPFTADHLRETVSRVARGTKTVLYVEDSRALHKVVVPPLLEEGYAVLQAYDGRHALDILESGQRVDLVLSDVDMPELDGLGLCRALKGDPRFAAIPLVLLTSRDSEEAVHAGFAEGADDYMMKPVVIPEMLARIARFLGDGAGAREERVLVVDAEPASAQMVCRSLATHGLRGEVCQDADLARSQLESGAFALAIIACDLRGADGVALARHLRDGARTRDIPLIMTSESSSLTEQVRVRSVGPQSFLVKPISPDRLLAEAERTLATARHRRQLDAMRGYLPEGAVEAIERRSLVGEELPRAEAVFRTIFFLDIVGFTSLCESLEPLAVVRFLNAFFDVVVATLVKHGATIDKFIGDCVMALFPRARSGPRRASTAAVEILSRLPELRAKTGIDVHVRIGIDAGLLVMGDIGSAHHRRDFTVIGDRVNVASRLQSSAGVDEILVSDAVAAHLTDGFIVAEVGRLAVKGRREPVLAYRVSADGLPSSEPASDI